MPYFYTVVREAHESGVPIMRSLGLQYRPLAVQRRDEYLWGPGVLVAPGIEKGAKSRRRYLSRGTWYEFWTDERISGGRETTRHLNLETFLLSVQAGSIMLFGRVKQYMTEPAWDALQLIIFPGLDGEFSLYEDDGVGFNYEQGHYARIVAGGDDHLRRLSICLTKGAASYEHH